MVLSTKMYHYIYFGNHNQIDDFLFNRIPNSYEEKKIRCNNEFKFEPHISNACTKAAQELGVLNRISSLLDPEEKQLISNAAIRSRFSYYPIMGVLPILGYCPLHGV